MKIATMWVLVLFPGLFLTAEYQEVSGVAGVALTVNCTYASPLVGRGHYWCKETERSICFLAVRTTGHEDVVKAGRFSIRDYRINLIFTATMMDLTEDDSGLYWCGTDDSGTDGIFRFKVTVSSFDLNSATPPVSATRKGSLPVGSHSSAVAASHLPWASFEERRITPADTVSAPSASYLALQWPVKAALLAIIPLTAGIIWIASRNRKRSMGGEGHVPTEDVLQCPVPGIEEGYLHP
ncbi:hypothetical protein NDU88_006608 [Pleurodeles waltl]|uniref:Immunoglobulin V-set domain-containing protein n=1 Tax=Pleurodeles waltl TaxID=8319 RepID=A0AAV7LXD3_PLEWA|nr:hypothetical protein NDU88_006608 [Pleurodeles waltl]